ncbi:MAG: UvrD-helicase domain-containing protein [Termitinemataceae bacterium]|nr:MAG: UvrD-helicase domain-containing protein [Termitinemataceae bacterium]
MEIPEYLEGLNDMQRQAVFHTGKPLLIIAGAGSGKTRVITTKIAYLIREKNSPPRSILAVTFTNKAAKEMAYRAAAIEPRAQDAMLRTFHSFGAYFLRCWGEYGGIDSNFNIYDDDDSTELLKSIPLMAGAAKKDLKLTAHLIAKAKDYFLDPDDAELEVINHTKKFRNIYKAYEDHLHKTGNVDFGDLIKKPVEILEANDELRSRIQDRFRTIMVDEYQDANVAQFKLLKTLCSKETYVCVVGDDDQSIYRFRGAEIKNILEFPKRFCAQDGSEADIIRLEQNYRSTKYILDAANSVISRNKGRLGKELKAERGIGLMPNIVFLSDQDEEVKYCGAKIKNSVKKQDPITGACGRYSDWAILYRTNAQSMGFENVFVRLKIPYKIVGTVKFYEREEIKDATALLSFMFNSKDEISFKRVVNKPARGLGKIAVERILDERFNTEDWNIELAAKNVLPNLSSSAKKGLENFLFAINIGKEIINGNKELIKDFNKQQSKSKTVRGADGLSTCLAALIIYSKIDQYHIEHDELMGEQRIANLQELINSASLYPASKEGLRDFLERIELDRTVDDDKENLDRVTLITMHNTKGLEFKNVIITGLEQGLFPRTDKNVDDLEEERRLFYVGATRAMDSLYLTCCTQRRIYGMLQFTSPSLFLLEMDKSKVSIEGNVPYGFETQSKYKSAPDDDYGTDDKINSILKSTGKLKTSSDGKWRLGDRVFHEDNGYGEVFSIKESEDGPIIKVRFEAGAVKQFLSTVQSSRFMKILD